MEIVENYPCMIVIIIIIIIIIIKDFTFYCCFQFVCNAPTFLSTWGQIALTVSHFVGCVLGR